jgi:hypothetical protein
LLLLRRNTNHVTLNSASIFSVYLTSKWKNAIDGKCWTEKFRKKSRKISKVIIDRMHNKKMENVERKISKVKANIEWRKVETCERKVSKGKYRMKKMSAEYMILFFQLVLAVIRLFWSFCLHSHIWAVIRLIQSDNARCEHLIIQLGAGASSSKETTRTTTFQRRFETQKTIRPQWNQCEKAVVWLRIINWRTQKIRWKIINFINPFRLSF